MTLTYTVPSTNPIQDESGIEGRRVHQRAGDQQYRCGDQRHRRADDFRCAAGGRDR